MYIIKFLHSLFPLRIYFVIGLLVLYGCADIQNPNDSDIDDKELTRTESIPENAIKMTPAMDYFPPVVHSEEYEDPLPLPDPVNTAGIEDAPVITADGTTFIFFFTPDGNIPVRNQILDGVSGIWWCMWDSSAWTEPKRAQLAGPNELHLDGPFAIQKNILWFGSARVENYGELDIWTAELFQGDWRNWQNAGEQINLDFDAGELYLTADGQKLFFGAPENEGGDLDLWLIIRDNQTWSEPVNLGPTINSSQTEYQPYISPNGSQLWFTRYSSLGYRGTAVFRSIRSGETWSEPEEMVSNYVGDPGLDAAGNLYFTHLFYDEEGNKIEADIYVAYRR